MDILLVLKKHFELSKNKLNTDIFISPYSESASRWKVKVKINGKHDWQKPNKEPVQHLQTGKQVGRFLKKMYLFFFESAVVGRKIMERCDCDVMCRGKCSSRSTITPRRGPAVWFHVALSSCELCLDHSQCIIENAQCSSCSGRHLTSNYGCMQQQKKEKKRKHAPSTVACLLQGTLLWTQVGRFA